MIKLNPDGDQCVRQLDTNNKLVQMEVDSTDKGVGKNINEIIKWYESVFREIAVQSQPGPLTHRGHCEDLPNSFTESDMFSS